MSDDSSKPESALKQVVPWHPILGVLVVLGLYAIAPAIASIVVGSGLSLTGQPDEGTTAQFLFILVIEALTFGGLLWFLKVRGSSLAAIGFGRPKLKHLGIGLAVYPIYFLAFLIIVVGTTVLFPGLNVDQEQQLGFDNVTGVIALIMTFVSLVVLPPLLEELTVRGLLFTSLRSRLGLSLSISITSLLFASAHLPAGGAEGPLYIAALDTFALSVVLCYVREKSGSLWPCITLHALKNGIAYVSLFIAPLIVQ